MKLALNFSKPISLLCVLFWMISAVVFHAESTKANEPERDYLLLQGSWHIEAHDIRGQPSTKEFLAEDHQWVIAKDSITIKNKEGVSRKGTFRLDPKKDHKELDITLEPGLQPGPSVKVPNTEILKCIYLLDGDTLKVCYGLLDARPSAFESKAETATSLVVFRRKDPPLEKPGTK